MNMIVFQDSFYLLPLLSLKLSCVGCKKIFPVNIGNSVCVTE